MYFANPWGLLGLLALPAIVVLHLYHRRFPPVLIGGLHLWGAESEVRHAGRRRERLPVTASLLLELLAALLFALLLAQPRRDESQTVGHLVVVLDDSASMQSRVPNGKTFRESAIEEIDRRFARLPAGSVATLIVTGRRPTMLAGPGVELDKARAALGAWRPNRPAHDFQSAWDLAAQLVEGGGRILFVSDHLPPKETVVPKEMEVVSVGRPLENSAITAARWTFDSAANKGRVYLRIANLGLRPTEVKIRAVKGNRAVFERSLPLDPGGDAALEAEVPGGLGELAVETSSPADALAIDNRATLIEPRARMVNLAITLPAADAAQKPIRRALAGIGETQFGAASDARLIIGPAGNLPASNRELWWLGVGPIDRSDAARKEAKSLVGPFLLERRHPLLEGVVLGGVVFGGVQPVNLDVTPLVSAGRFPLLCRLNGTLSSAYLLNLDFAKSNLADSPDWPILMKNLVDLCRDSLPGLKRGNFRLNEEIAFRIGRPPGDARESSREPLALVFGEKSRPLARADVVEVPPLDETGIYEIHDGERTIGRFAVNFQDPAESTLAALGPGIRDAVAEDASFGYRLDDPFSWLIAGGIAAILAAVLADWFVLRPARRPV